MKKLILVGMLISLFSICISINANNEKIFCEFSSTKRILKEKQLEDFGSNQFLLYELEDGYAIYAIDNEKEIFVEGSYKTNSLYSLVEDNLKLYYLGPGEYFYQKEDMVYNIRTGENWKRNELYSTFRLNSVSLESNSFMSRNANHSSHIDENGFTVVNEDKYFRNLSYFPENWFGECGLVALSILLGYLDTFHNDNFIPNGKLYGSRYYVDNGSIDEAGDAVYDSVDTVIEELAKKVTYSYVDVDSYDLELWPTTAMPGTNYAMRDYLLDNYLHTYGIWEKPGVKDLKKNRPSPMADEELKNTLKDYMNANCSSLLNKITIRSGNVVYTHQHPKDYIQSGVPTILVLADYKQETKGILNTNWHDVVAYGYKGDQFLVHMGWWPGDTFYSDIVISSATIYGYFAVEYTGEHIHSQNVIMQNNGETSYICGCGYIQKHRHTYNIYENFNNDYHLSSCSCGESIKEPHEWKFMSGKAAPKPTAKCCQKCGVIVLL